jgi:hypothetical protein
MTGFGLSAFGAITMFFIRRSHESNKVHHAAELNRLLAIARSDKH